MRVTRHLLASSLLYPASCTLVESPDFIYQTCSQVSVGGNGLVYTAVRFGRSEPPKACSSDDLLVLKCATRDQSGLISREYELMRTLSSVSWIPNVHEFFNRVDGSSRDPCISMEQLGYDLEKIRLSYPEGTQWSWVTLGSIGARMTEMVEALHNDYSLTHTDLHAGNWMLTRSVAGTLSPVLKMIDFGDTRSRTVIGSDLWHYWIREEIRQIVIGIRYMFDGDFKYYVWKRYSFNEAEICAGIPSTLCDALVYVNNLAECETIDYARVRQYMVTLVEQHGGTYSGEILWEPTLTVVGAPTVQERAPRPATVIAHEGDTSTTVFPSTASGSVTANADSPKSKAGRLPVGSGTMSASAIFVIAILAILA